MTDQPSLYDAQIDLSTGDGGVPREKMKDWMRVRLFGSSVRRTVSVPPNFVGSIYFINDNAADVAVRRGCATPVVVGRGSIGHIMFDGSASGMRDAR